MPKISGRVFAVPSGKRLFDGIVYVVPTPGAPSGISIGLMWRILPLRSFVLPAVRCASQYSRPGCSSIGSKPSESNGFAVVARRGVEAPVRPEGERTRRVAALRGLVQEGEDLLLGREVERVAVDLQARDDLRERVVRQLRVEEVH